MLHWTLGARCGSVVLEIGNRLHWGWVCGMVMLHWGLGMRLGNGAL